MRLGPQAVALWRNCDNPDPIGFAFTDPLADAWQGTNPHLVRAQALGLVGWRVGAAKETAVVSEDL